VGLDTFSDVKQLSGDSGRLPVGIQNRELLKKTRDLRNLLSKLRVVLNRSDAVLSTEAVVRNLDEVPKSILVVKDHDAYKSALLAGGPKHRKRIVTLHKAPYVLRGEGAPTLIDYSVFEWIVEDVGQIISDLQSIALENEGLERQVEVEKEKSLAFAKIADRHKEGEREALELATEAERRAVLAESMVKALKADVQEESDTLAALFEE